MKMTARALIAALIALPLLVLAGPGHIIENPAKPKAANAGRVIAPQEVLAISDEGTSDYYFKWPRELRAGPDGSLLFIDVSQALHFDQNGKFLQNLFKKGQGPGEINNASACLAVGARLVVHSPYPNKLVFFDPSGKYDKEMAVRVEDQGFLKALFYQAPAFYMKSTEFPRTSGDPDFVDRPETLSAIDATTGEGKALAAFMTKAYVIAAPSGGGGLFDVTNLVAAPFNKKLIVLTHTEEYLLKIYDPEANTITREFRRAYDRVKGAPLTEAERRGGIFIDNKHYTRPERKFENDVRNILCRESEIWAVTSTRDEAQGVLIDVFDGDGVYRDCFWLKLPEPALGSLQSPGQCTLDGEFLWVVARAEDEAFTIRKYRVVI